MVGRKKDLWSLVQGQQYVAPEDLADALQEEVRRDPLDFRTRLLIRDSADALEQFWGGERWGQWLRRCPGRNRLESIRAEDLGEPGFPFLLEQLMVANDADSIRQFLRELGTTVHHPVRISVAGAITLILQGFLLRHTQDLDVVDEVPPEIRGLGKKLDQLTSRYRLQLGHVQSHYLPSGWADRVHGLEPFGLLQVYLVDVYDVFLSKLFSLREKDRDDLLTLAPQLDKETIIRKLRDTTAPFLANDTFRQQAETNWYIVFGEPLPS